MGKEIFTLVTGMFVYWIVGAAFLVILGAPVLTVYMIIGRLMLKPTVTELQQIRKSLAGIERAVGRTVADQVSQVVQQLYQANTRQTVEGVKR